MCGGDGCGGDVVCNSQFYCSVPSHIKTNYSTRDWRPVAKYVPNQKYFWLPKPKFYLTISQGYTRIEYNENNIYNNVGVNTILLCHLLVLLAKQILRSGEQNLRDVRR